MSDATGPDYAGTYDPDTDFDRWYTLATGAAIVRWLRPGQRVLELGCATGLMSAALVAAGTTVTAVDRSERYLAVARGRGLPGTVFVEGNVDEYDDGAPYDHVVATNLIHELPDPAGFLRRCRDRIVPGGQLHLSLQNPRSIHRLAALDLGLIRDLYEVSARGRKYATVQLFDADQLSNMGEQAGMSLRHREGVMLKPLPNHLMATLPDEVLEGFVAVARHFPDHCAINYLVLQR